MILQDFAMFVTKSCRDFDKIFLWFQQDVAMILILNVIRYTYLYNIFLFLFV